MFLFAPSGSSTFTHMAKGISLPSDITANPITDKDFKTIQGVQQHFKRKRHTVIASHGMVGDTRVQVLDIFEDPTVAREWETCVRMREGPFPMEQMKFELDMAETIGVPFDRDLVEALVLLQAKPRLVPRNWGWISL